MNNIIAGFLQWIADRVIGGVLWLAGAIANSIQTLAVQETQLPWVQNLRVDIMVVAFTLLGLAIAYKALQTYILWGEGTSDPDGSVLVKSILRAVVFMGISGFLATAVFTWGIQLAGVIAASPMLSAVQAAALAAQPFAQPAPLGVGIGLALALLAGLAAGIVLLLVACFQMAIRAAELIVYVLAAPIVAIGQLNSDGGTWGAWWTNLVILSLSQAVTILSFKGFIGTTQILTATHPPAWVSAMLATAGSNPAGTLAGNLGAAVMASAVVPVMQTLLVILMMVGWMVVAIRGPHMLKQWSYRSGVGGAGMFISQKLGPRVGKGLLSGTRFGTFLGF